MTHGFRGFGIELTSAEAAALAQNPNVARVEENGEGDISYTVQSLPSDDSLWHLDRIDNFGPISGTKLYAYTTTGSNVNLYVIGMGVQARHAEFDLDADPGTSGSRVTTGVDYFTGMPDGNGGSFKDSCCTGTDLSGQPFVTPTPDNPCGGYTNALDPGHDTAVASIAGGSINGVAKNVRIVPVKIIGCGTNGTLSGRSSLGMCWALDWILQDMQSFANAGRRAVVVCATFWNTPTTELCNGVNCVSAIENNVNNVIGGVINGVRGTIPGIPVVVSANNQNNGSCATSPARMGDPTYPTYYHTITVGATDIGDQRWCDGDCTTTAIGSNFGQCVNIYAPGANVHGAHIAGFTSYRSDGSNFQCPGPYCGRTAAGVQSGTSFAAPVVAGVAARLLEGNNTWTPQDVWTEIQRQANRVSYSFDPSGNYNNLLLYLSPYN